MKKVMFLLIIFVLLTGCGAEDANVSDTSLIGSDGSCAEVPVNEDQTFPEISTEELSNGEYNHPSSLFGKKIGTPDNWIFSAKELTWVSPKSGIEPNCNTYDLAVEFNEKYESTQCASLATIMLIYVMGTDVAETGYLTVFFNVGDILDQVSPTRDEATNIIESHGYDVHKFIGNDAYEVIVSVPKGKEVEAVEDFCENKEVSLATPFSEEYLEILEEETTDSELLTINAKEMPLRFSYPSNWRLSDLSSLLGIIDIYPPEVGLVEYTNFEIIEKGLEEPLTYRVEDLDEYLEYLQERDVRDSTHEILDIEETKVDVKDAYKLTYLYERNQVTTYEIVFITTYNEQIYSFKYSSNDEEKYNKYLKDVEAIISSIEFI